MVPSSLEDLHFRLLVLTGRKRLSSSNEGELRLLLHEEEDWNQLVNLAGYHGVYPLLYSHLRKVESGVVPEEVLMRLRGIVGVQSAGGIALEYELGRLAVVFDHVGLPFIAIKGPVLAHTVYGSVALRPFVDLDLVVRRKDYLHVEALVEGEGYESIPLTPFQKSSYLYIHGQYSFWRRSAKSGALSLLDIHAAVMPPGYAYDEAFDDLLERSITVPVAGQEVRALEREDLLQVLCFHGFKNRWDRLKYFCDVAEFLRAYPDLDWDTVYHRARAMHSERVLRLGLLLAQRLLDAPLPEEVARDVERDERAQTLGTAILERLPQQAHMRVEPYWDRVRLNILAQDGLRGVLRYGGYAAARRITELYMPSEP